MTHDKMRVNNKISSSKMTVQTLFGQVHTVNLKESPRLPEWNQKMKESSGLLKLISKSLREKKNGITDHSNSTMFKALAAKISTHHMVMIVV